MIKFHKGDTLVFTNPNYPEWLGVKGTIERDVQEGDTSLTLNYTGGGSSYIKNLYRNRRTMYLTPSDLKLSYSTVDDLLKDYSID